MFVIGLTGGIGSGKTEVAKLLEKKGLTVIDSDSIGHKLLLSQEVKNELVKEFGEQVLTENEIDRKKLAQIVFTQNVAKSKINQIIHPRVIDEIMKKIREEEKKGKKVIIIESALISEDENSLPSYVNGLILVTAPEEIRIQRLINFRRMSYNEAKSRIISQRNPDEKRAIATWIIHNDADFDKLKLEVEKVIEEINNVVGRLQPGTM